MHCVLCHPDHEMVVWKSDKLRVIQVEDPKFPGYFRVIWNDHVAEMSDLTDEDRNYLETVLISVEKTVRELMRPDKINWAQFGNMVPHLHWHIVARYQDDSHFPESIWGVQQRKANTEKLLERKKMADNAAAAIAKALDLLFQDSHSRRPCPCLRARFWSALTCS